MLKQRWPMKARFLSGNVSLHTQGESVAVTVLVDSEES